jgi:hypothetical protein
VAQSVFDPLRQKKRDALCAYILTLSAIVKFGATDTNGLFEYFLVDPGMEPVVQTSRIRLALSSVQTFIQRCLLNLEPQVKPSVLNADNWAWMKRYRVWEANREIFLWPENWLIPEFRENATDLFQALQGTLLQGDITQDLVEQAYTQYLQDLDTRAQLDIVSMFNQPPAAGDAATANTLHVIGRNHGKPRKYFYRTYANGIWNGWIPVTPDIEGDHVVAVIWRGRLTIFWLTFAVQSGPANTATASQSNSDGTSSSSNVTSLSFGDFSNLVTAGKPPTTMQIQLNWSEYYQNKWTTRSSSDLNQFTPVQVKDGFAPSADVLARASIDTDSNGNETAVRLHLDYSDGGGWAFRLTGKNSEPAFSAANWEPLQDTGYYDTSAWDATKYVGYSPDPTTNPESGSALFQVEFTQQMSLAGGEVQSSSSTTASILQNVNSFNLLLCDNLPLAAVNGPANSPYQNFTNQITFLSSPLFYEDTTDPNTSNELCFFVQPAVTETSVSRWVGWAIRPTFPDLTINNPNYWNVVNLTAQVPIRYLPVQPDPAALVSYRPNLDVFANDATRVSYGTAVIGRAGATTASANVAGALRGAGAKIISSAGLGIGGALSIAAKPQTKDFAATTKSHFIQ